jgi:flagellar M-ring protein FliF
MVFYDFNQPSVPVAADPAENEMQLRDLLIYGGAALVLIAILSFVIIFIVNKRRKKKEADIPEAAVSSDTTEFSWEDIKEGIKVQETQEQAIKKQLREFTKSNPEIAAQLVRTWLKGDD